MGGKTTKTETKNEVKVPEWVSRGGEQTYNDASSFIKSNPVRAFGGQRSAPVSENQDYASMMAMGKPRSWLKRDCTV